MKSNLKYIFWILITSLVFASCGKCNSLCEIAIRKANVDFTKGRYSLHSLETLPIQETYYKTLKDSFNVQYLFTDSMNFYNCYDSIMLLRLNDKYGIDIIANSRSIVAQLESTENWIRKSEYIGGESELLKFIFSNMDVANYKVKDEITNTKVIVEFTIDTTGNVKNISIRRGINKEIDNQILEIFKIMPKWSPAYKFGEPIEEKWILPMQLEFE